MKTHTHISGWNLYQIIGIDLDGDRFTWTRFASNEAKAREALTRVNVHVVANVREIESVTLVSKATKSANISYRKRMPRSARMRSIHINARRWTDNVGSTYHTSQIAVNGEYVANVKMQYGYDEHYLQTAYESLIQAGKIRPRKGTHSTYESMREWAQRQKIKITHCVQDVRRMRDL